MNVRMMLEGLAPGVKHAEEADLRTEMPGGRPQSPAEWRQWCGTTGRR
jgi:hypothetical protein